MTETTRKSILAEAEKCVCTDREQEYSSPEDNFSTIAALWEPYLWRKCVSPGADVCIEPEDVGVLMALLKIGRIASGQAKADNYVDLAGYACCAGEIALREMQADHVIPMEFYDAYKAIGADIDSPDNMYPACRSCNYYKSTLTLEKLREAIEKWPEVLARDSVTYRNAVRFGMVVPNPQPVVFYFEKLAQDAPEEGETKCKG